MRNGLIKVVDVQNDGQPRSLIILTGLKTLFQKQLPKMPREYIARLVFDDNSRAMAIIKRGYKVVGGITFRPFPHRGFAEIVFFATASVDQVKVRPFPVLPLFCYRAFNAGIRWHVDESLQDAHQEDVSRHDAFLDLCGQLRSRIFQETGERQFVVPREAVDSQPT